MFSPGSPIRATLRPLPSAQFLLVLQPQPPPRCQPLNPGSTLPRHLRPLILQPLGLPVLLLGSHSTTPPQHAHLSSTFETVLGSAWKQGRAERRLSTQLANEHFSDWSVYWVPLVSEQPDISKTAPIQLAAEWQRRQGINTIWPTHLVDDLSSEYSTLSRKRLKPSPLIKLPRTDELMGVAADVFDFLSNFHEPPPITVTPREDDTTAVEMENVDEPEESSLFGGDEEPKPDPEPGSDIDDLFSTRSGSPGPPEPLPLDPDEIAGQTFNGLLEEPDVEHVVEFWDDVFMASSPRPVAAVDRPGASEVADDTILVTEDDFNFFDSPAEATEDVQPAESDEHDIPAEAAPVEVVDENVAEIAVAPIVAEPDEHAGHDDANRHEAAESPISPVSPLQPVTEPTEERPQPSPPHPKRPPLPHLERLDFIPSPFEALPLGVAPQPPSFTYDLPSPAPTPESLRPELIDRLRHSKRAKLDYAATWEVESEASEVGDEDDYSGAPPTPVSEVDTGDTQSPKDTPRSHRGSLSQDEVEFKGIICVGIEWFSLKDDQAAMNPLCRAWNAGWIEGRLSPVSDGNLASLPRHPSFRVELLSTLDCDRFGSETIANRHFRNLFTPASDMEVASDTVALPPLLTGGDDLESISRSGETVPSSLNDRVNIFGRCRTILHYSVPLAMSDTRGILQQRHAFVRCGLAVLARARASACRREEGHHGIRGGRDGRWLSAGCIRIPAEYGRAVSGECIASISCLVLIIGSNVDLARIVQERHRWL